MKLQLCDQMETTRGGKRVVRRSLRLRHVWKRPALMIRTPAGVWAVPRGDRDTGSWVLPAVFVGSPWKHNLSAPTSPSGPRNPIPRAAFLPTPESTKSNRYIQMKYGNRQITRSPNTVHVLWMLISLLSAVEVLGGKYEARWTKWDEMWDKPLKNKQEVTETATSC